MPPLTDVGRSKLCWNRAIRCCSALTGWRLRELRRTRGKTDPRIVGTEELHTLLGMTLPASATVPAAPEDDEEDDDEDGDLYVTDAKRPASAQSATPSETKSSSALGKLTPYASLVIEPSTILPPVKVTYHGRDDVLANTTARTQAWRTQRKEKGAAKKAAKGKGEKLAKLHREALWVS